MIQVIIPNSINAPLDGLKLDRISPFEGLCYYPTVLNNVKDNMKVLREETFGPVALIISVENVEEAIHVANNSAYGLSAAIMTEDMQKGLEIAEELETGIAHINDAKPFSLLPYRRSRS